MRALATCLVLGFLGCGASGLERARAVLIVTAQAGAIADERATEAYEDAHIRALSGSESRAEYDKAMAPWDRMVGALESLRDALRGAWIATYVAENARKGDYLAAMGCVAAALSEVWAAMHDVGVPPPEALDRALDVSLQFPSALCDA